MQLAYSSQSPVTDLPPSEKGFYDVLGNAWEWGEDHFSAFPGFKVWSSHLRDPHSVSFSSQRLFSHLNPNPLSQLFTLSGSSLLRGLCLPLLWGKASAHHWRVLHLHGTASLKVRQVSIPSTLFPARHLPSRLSERRSVPLRHDSIWKGISHPSLF